MSDSIPVHIYFVLDRSGSMSSIQRDVIGGFNAFVAEQKAQPGKCRLTLVQFDTQGPHEVIHDAVKIADVPDLTTDSFQPRGGTPLLDAEGWTINRAIDREKARAEAGKKAEAILFVTYTDGQENQSREWTKEALSAAKATAEQKGWTFTYLGCGHDSYGQASQIGTVLASVQNFAGDSQGVASSYASLGAATRSMRGRAAKGMRVASADFYEETGKTAEEDLLSRT
jgi:Mg-chelatase subunit ChlD